MNMTARFIKYMLISACMILVMQAVCCKLYRNDKHEEQSIAQLINDTDKSNIYPTANSSDSEFAIPVNTLISSTSRTSSSIRRTSVTGFSGYTLMKSGKLINRHNFILYHISLNKFPYGFTKTQIHLVSLGKLIIQHLYHHFRFAADKCLAVLLVYCTNKENKI